MSPEPTAEPEFTAATSCGCFTDDAFCADCRSCLDHHDLDDCDNWVEFTKEGWH
jgi:hypothetical protein